MKSEVHRFNLERTKLSGAIKRKVKKHRMDTKGTGNIQHTEPTAITCHHPHHLEKKCPVNMEIIHI
jgi:hypothetical protein